MSQPESGTKQNFRSHGWGVSHSSCDAGVGLAPERNFAVVLGVGGGGGVGGLRSGPVAAAVRLAGGKGGGWSSRPTLSDPMSWTRRPKLVLLVRDAGREVASARPVTLDLGSRVSMNNDLLC
jgi:hypothetical protein